MISDTMNNPFTSRDFLAAHSTCAIAVANFGSGARAQAQTSLSVRVDTDVRALDPAFRGGPPDGNLLRIVHQRLIALKTNSVETELDAASELKQINPTLIEFTLKPVQMFTDG